MRTDVRKNDSSLIVQSLLLAKFSSTNSLPILCAVTVIPVTVIISLHVSRVSHLPAWRQREPLSLVAFIIIYLQLACASIDTSPGTHDAYHFSFSHFFHACIRARINAYACVEIICTESARSRTQTAFSW